MIEVKPAEPPVDLPRLREMGGDDLPSVRKLVGLYLAQADDLMNSLQAALQANSPSDVALLAHKLGGSSSTCGMTAIVAPLRELEQLGKAGRLPEHEPLLAEASRQLEFTRQFLAAHGLWERKPKL
jgi:HPt (histidine-containing phosphotransfer) domain-containing protein